MDEKSDYSLTNMKDSNRTDRTPDDLQTVRSRIVNKALYVTAILAFPVLILSISRLVVIGWHPIYYLHITLYLMVFGTVIFIKRLPFFVRTSILTSVFAILGVTGLYTFSLASNGILALAIFSILISMLFGTRKGIIAMGISLCIIGIIGVGVSIGMITFSLDFNNFVTSMTPWLTTFAAFAFLVGIVVVGLGTIQEYLTKINESLKKEMEDRKRMEKTLRESEERYRLLFETSSDAIMLLTEDGFFGCNDQTLKLFGLTNREEFIGLHPSELSPPNQPDGENSLTASNNKIAEAVRNGHNKFDWVYRRKSGEDFPADVLLTSFQLKGKQVVQATVRDITELSKYRSRLEVLVKERTQELNQSLADNEQAREELLESERQLSARNRIADIFLTRSETGMYGDVLDVILDVMASKYGFFGYINEDGDMVAPSMTKEIMDECQMIDKDIIFPRRDWVAMWGKTLLEKKTLYMNKGLHLPEGHVALARAVTVPIIYQQKLIGILAVADKETDYDESDRQLLETISAHIAPILSARLQMVIEERTRQEAEKKLQESLAATEQARDSIDAILKSVADGLIVTDSNNRIVLMNRAAEDLLGVRFSEVIDRPIDFFIKDKALADKAREVLAKKTTGVQSEFELQGDDPKHPRIMRARTSVIVDKALRETGMVTDIRDVTHEHEVDRMKTEFISTAAHELRTPLTSIQGFSEILLTRKNLKSEEKRKFLTYINKQSVGLASIISDLLDISRIESGHGFTLNKTLGNAGDVIKEIFLYLREQYKKHRLELILPEESLELLCDKEKMEQVIKNIVSNAVKYSPEGSLIQIFGELFEGYYQVSVKDQGIGMTPEQVEKVFDKFYRVDASNTAIEGTGLGMAVVKHIVEAHGGKVWVESELGKRTTVTFTIPT